MRAYADSLQLVPTKLRKGEVYGFNPTGWSVFAVIGSNLHVGATEMVAVNEETGDVRSLGMVGE